VTDAFTDFTPVGEPERGLSVGLWTRRAFMALLTLVVLAALADRFGQRRTQATGIGPAASLHLTAPHTVRGGLFFESRVEVVATQDISNPRLVLDRGWFDGMQANSIEPQPTNESSRDGRVVLSYDQVSAGEILRVWLQFEVNPTNVGQHPYGIELDDGTAPVARIDRTITAMP
jgi:hypothetical protein